MAASGGGVGHSGAWLGARKGCATAGATWHMRFGCSINGQHAAVVTGVNGSHRVPKHPTGTAPQGSYALCATANVLCCLVWCRLAEFVPQEANFALLPNLVCTNGSNFCS